MRDVVNGIWLCAVLDPLAQAQIKQSYGQRDWQVERPVCAAASCRFVPIVELLTSPMAASTASRLAYRVRCGAAPAFSFASLFLPTIVTIAPAARAVCSLSTQTTASLLDQTHDWRIKRSLIIRDHKVIVNGVGLTRDDLRASGSKRPEKAGARSWHVRGLDLVVPRGQIFCSATISVRLGIRGNTAPFPYPVRLLGALDRDLEGRGCHKQGPSWQVCAIRVPKLLQRRRKFPSLDIEDWGDRARSIRGQDCDARQPSGKRH
jgi:hypothetical protein